MVEINGIAHVMISVGNFEACAPFYRTMLGEMGMKPVVDGDGYLYCVGGRTAVGVQAADEKFRGDRFVQGRPGLHHLCFRARSPEDVDRLHEIVVRLGANVVHPPEEGPWAPGYYSMLFEDPDGTRLEINFVPGKGLLKEGG